MPLPAAHREVRLAALPDGALTGHFEVVSAPLPTPGPGQVLVRNRLMSVAAVVRPSAARVGGADRGASPGGCSVDL